MIKENLAKYIRLFDKPDRRYFFIILLLTFVVVILETLSIGLIIPALQILSSFDSNENTLKIFTFLELENYSKERLFINVLDYAEPSIDKSHPKIILILFIFIFLGFIINVLLHIVIYNVKRK